MKDSKLDNGLRVIYAPMAGTRTITVLVMFKTGSKYEKRENNGISHFLEHMFFKGTDKRPTAMDISSELDSVGAEYNAFTAKEYTGYWIKMAASKAEKAVDIISDMLMNSKFDAEEIEREKGVIIEEANMYHDNPMMYIEDVFEECLYGDTPAGWEIVGPKDNIRNFTRKDFVDYHQTQYGARSAVVCMAGNTEGKESLAKDYFSKFIENDNFRDKPDIEENQDEPRCLVREKKTDQVNLSLGVRAYPYGHKDEYALKMLSVLLGGSMSSRMFHQVRERRGLAYYVRTNYEALTDSGYLTTQAGVPVGKQDEAIKVILAEYKKIKEEGVPEKELQRTKDLIKGRSVISLESSDDMANWYGKQAVLKGEVKTPEQFFDKINEVSAKDIKRVAEDIFSNNGLNLAVIGPFKGQEEFSKLLDLG